MICIVRVFGPFSNLQVIIDDILTLSEYLDSLSGMCFLNLILVTYFQNTLPRVEICLSEMLSSTKVQKAQFHGEM